MKKFLRTAVAVMLALGLSCTALAVPSRTDFVEISNAVDANGQNVEVTVSSSEIPLLTEAEAAETIGGILEADVTILTQIDVSVPEGTQFPVTITFSVSGIKSGDKVYVFHYTGSDWEIVPSTVGENSVTATFSSLSPVAIVKVNDEDNGGNGGDGTGPDTNTDKGKDTGTDRTSPKTGMTDITGIALAAIVVAGAGVYVSRKKKA